LRAKLSLIKPAPQKELVDGPENFRFAIGVGITQSKSYGIGMGYDIFSQHLQDENR
jgi:hypothetical protein